jgi:K(+)-stimulated pyrophosphate-energized sodium pump
MNASYIIIFGSIILALIYIVNLSLWLRKQDKGNEKMQKISLAIQEGSRAFLKRQYKTVGIVGIIIFVILYFTLGLLSALSFLLGGISSALAGFLGMKTAVSSNAKTAAAAQNGLKPSLGLAFKAGSITGFLVVTLGLLTVSALYFITQNVSSLISLGFGASLISVFARLGGGIFTKAADVGTDLVGKIEANIPEDDPRNPGVIADNVGDNVGDCAGMAADLFETYAVTLTASLLIGSALSLSGTQLIFPLIIGGLAILASIVGTFFVKVGKNESIMGALYKGLGVSALMSVILFYFASKFLILENSGKIFLSSLTGILISVLMVVITDYYTSKKYRPVKSIAEASKSGHGTNIIMGLSVGMESTFLPILLVGAGIIVSYSLAGIYGIAIATTSMLSLAGIIISIDSFGPITDNAGGIAEMSNAPENIRKITDSLDAVGNTTKAITKGYAIASAGLAALVLFSAYADSIKMIFNNYYFDIQNPYVLVGLFLGASIPYLFGSLAMKSVGKAAGSIVEEIRRQFREIKGLLEGNALPDYERAVDIVTKSALKEMILPTIFPIVMVLLTGFILGKEALGGLLMGTIISGLFIAISMTSGGAAWDNAKKFIEAGNFGGKGSETHKAAITGDTVGDPYKDTAGPAINPLIKVINIIALLIVKFIR